MAITRSAFLLRMLHGRVEPYMDRKPEAASQSFKAGDLVYMASGYLTVCGADPTSIYGIANEAAHNAAAGAYTIEVLVITSETIIGMQVYHSTPANNVIEDTDNLASYGIAVSSNLWYIDKTETSNKRIVITEFYDALGATNGIVGVQFLAANRQVQ